MNALSSRERELVALGAAIASNCVPCIEYHVPEARNAGLSDTQIKEALKIADKVRRVPARAVMRTALARTNEGPEASAATAVTMCGCSESKQNTAPASVGDA
jgi:4-carboxymuconolactone decarboxylase